jgi:GNAT superfamily N-acetyltransferase
MSTLNEVRPATEADLAEVVSLWSHYLRANPGNPAYKRLPADAVEARTHRFMDHIRSPESEVFVVDGAYGGLEAMLTCFVEDNYPYFHPPRFGRLQSPFVRPEARRRGHLRNLLVAAYGWARRLELTEVRLYTSADALVANALAEEFGFTAFEVVRRKAIDWCLPPEEQV